MSEDNFVIVLMNKSDRERLDTFCEKKNIAVYEYCSQAILNALNKEVKN